MKKEITTARNYVEALKDLKAKLKACINAAKEVEDCDARCEALKNELLMCVDSNISVKVFYISDSVLVVELNKEPKLYPIETEAT